MASSHKWRAPLIASGLPLRDFVMTILMRSSPLNRVHITETRTMSAEGGNLPPQDPARPWYCSSTCGLISNYKGDVPQAVRGRVYHSSCTMLMRKQFTVFNQHCPYSRD